VIDHHRGLAGRGSLTEVEHVAIESLAENSDLLCALRLASTTFRERRASVVHARLARSTAALITHR
jgi:hypothetical protein